MFYDFIIHANFLIIASWVWMFRPGCTKSTLGLEAYLPLDALGLQLTPVAGHLELLTEGRNNSLKFHFWRLHYSGRA